MSFGQIILKFKTEVLEAKWPFNGCFIYDKIKDESKEEVHRLELDLIVQRELTKKMEEKISKIYEGQVEKLEKQIETLSIQSPQYQTCLL